MHELTEKQLKRRENRLRAKEEKLRKEEEAVAEMIYQTEDCKRGLTSLTENENGPMCEFLGR